MTAPSRTDAQRVRDERDALRRRIDSFAHLVDVAERGGATVLPIDQIRRGLHIGARR